MSESNGANNAGDKEVSREDNEDNNPLDLTSDSRAPRVDNSASSTDAPVSEGSGVGSGPAVPADPMGAANRGSGPTDTDQQTSFFMSPGAAATPLSSVLATNAQIGTNEQLVAALQWIVGQVQCAAPEQRAAAVQSDKRLRTDQAVDVSTAPQITSVARAAAATATPAPVPLSTPVPVVCSSCPALREENRLLRGEVRVLTRRLEASRASNVVVTTESERLASLNKVLATDIVSVWKFKDAIMSTLSPRVELIRGEFPDLFAKTSAQSGSSAPRDLSTPPSDSVVGCNGGDDTIIIGDGNGTGVVVSTAGSSRARATPSANKVPKVPSDWRRVLAKGRMLENGSIRTALERQYKDVNRLAEGEVPEAVKSYAANAKEYRRKGVTAAAEKAFSAYQLASFAKTEKLPNGRLCFHFYYWKDHSVCCPACASILCRNEWRAERIVGHQSTKNSHSWKDGIPIEVKFIIIG